jgi:hypothetical protein
MTSPERRDLEQIARLPGVRSAVQGDLAGAFVDAVREADGETAAAVSGFLAATLLGAGEQLGLGALRRVTLQGPARAGLVLVQDGAVIAATVEPAALAGVERALETPTHRER